MGALAVDSIIKNNYPMVTIVKDGKVQLAELSKCIQKADHNFIQYQSLVQTLSI
jgi:hypothetical protein